MDVRPFLHRWSTKPPSPPPTVCTPLGYVHLRRVMLILQQLEGKKWPNHPFPSTNASIILPAQGALDNCTTSNGTHHCQGSPTQQSNGLREHVALGDDIIYLAHTPQIAWILNCKSGRAGREILNYNIKKQTTINCMVRIRSGNAWRGRDVSIGECKSM